MNGQHRHTWSPRRRVANPPTVQIAIHVHPCVACGTLTGRTWFCIECGDRARQYVEDDPYDEIGGEGEAAG